MSYPTPTELGCAAVSWVNGNAIAIRVFYSDTQGRLIMSTYDNPDLNDRISILPWKATVPQINGAPIQGIFENGWRDSITAVSVHPNTSRHEIHVFYMAAAGGSERILQSAILDVTNGKWFMDNVIGSLNSENCPSAAIGWEAGTKNAFRLYYCREKEHGLLTRTSEVREIAFDNGNWYRSNNDKPLDTFDESASIGGNPSAWRSRVAACTWPDGAGVRQIRVYRSDIDEKFVELLYKPAENKWVRAGSLGTKCFGARGVPLVAIPIKSAGGRGIRLYSLQARTQSGGGTWPQTEKGNVCWKENGFEESSGTWFESKLPIDATGLYVMAPEYPIEWRKIQFAVTSWNWPDSSKTSIRIYRVATIENKAELAYMNESCFDTFPNSQWAEGSARF